MDYQELSKQLAQAFENGQFQQAVDLGRALEEQFQAQMVKEDWYRYGEALRRTEHPGEALEVSRRLYRSHSGIPQIRMLYAWCVYDTAIKKEDEEIAEDEQQFYRAAKAVLSLVGDQPAQAFSPHVRAVFRLIDYVEAERRDPAEEMLDWVQRLQVEELSEQIGYWRKEDGSVVELPSDREKWYSAYTKALYQLERYQECLDACEEALRRLPAFSGTNRVWMRRRRALCNGALGYAEIALEELKEVLAIEERWFICYEISRLYYADQQWPKALEYALRGALDGEVDAFRWKLYAFISVIAKKVNEPSAAEAHARLALSLRKQAGWSMGEQHKRLAKQYGIDTEQLRSPDQLTQELRSWWEQHRTSEPQEEQLPVNNEE